MADIRELEAEVRRLRMEMSAQRSRADRKSAEIEEQNRAALRAMREQAELMITEDREYTRLQYEELLDDTVGKLKAGADEKANALRAEYERVSALLTQAIDEERDKVRLADERQTALEDSYGRRREELYESAMQAVAENRETLTALCGELPAEWFLPGRRSFYQRQIGTACELIDKGIYEAAVGVSDNTAMSMELDRQSVISAYSVWRRYFTVLCGIIKSEHELLINSRRRTEGLSQELCDSEGISGGMLSEEMFSFWSGDSMADSQREHERDYAYLCDFAGTDISASVLNGNDDQIKEAMAESAEKAAAYSSAQLYSAAKKAGERLEHEIELVRSVKSRLKAFDERCDICAQLGDIMYECGFSEQPAESYYENDDRRRGITAVYDDYGGFMTAVISIVPSRREYDGKWFNMLGCSVESDTDTGETENLLISRLYACFEPQGVSVYRKPELIRGQSENGRCLLLERELSRTINGHSQDANRS